jgi:nicotinamidase-related amidase
VAETSGLIHGPLTARTVHLCVDMQRLFSDDGPWPAAWMTRVLPVARRLAARFPERTVFTRFLPPRRPEDMPGLWRRYYERWRHVTREQIDPRLLDLLPELADLAPPAAVVDKDRYTAFAAPALAGELQRRQCDSLVVSGAETDVCVLASVLSAVDRGFRVVVAVDAICSSSDAGHDALLTLYNRRFGLQIETADSETILSAWQG